MQKKYIVFLVSFLCVLMAMLHPAYSMNQTDSIPFNAFRQLIRFTYDSSATYFPNDTNSAACEISGTFPIAKEEKAGWLNLQIKNMIGLAANLSFEEGVKTLEKAYIDDYRRNAYYDSVNKQGPEWLNENNTSVSFNKYGYIVLKSEGYDYSGGAHGNPWLAYSCFDLIQKKRMLLKDVVMADSLTLQNLLEQQFRKDNDLQPTDSLTGILFNNYLPPNNNFSFTDSGILFTYNPYEVAPYSSGIFSILISYKELERYLSPAFKRRMKL